MAAQVSDLMRRRRRGQGHLKRCLQQTSPADSQEKIEEEKLYNTSDIHICSHKLAQPTVFIPVFPGTKLRV